jgi:hypothetical protein
VDRRKLRRLDLHHWSWIDVLTEAIVQMEHRGVSDPDQAYILGELIRYLSDTRSGAVAFDGMGSSWVAVRDGARDMTLRKSDPAVASVAARWDDLIRYLALGLTADLGHQVRQVLPPSERTAAGRRHALVDALTGRGQLHAELAIPDAAGSLVLVADLRARQVMASTSIDAPRDGTSKGRVSWLLRQIQDAPEGLKVEVRIRGTSRTLAAPLRAVREDPAVIYPDKGREIGTFLLTLSGNMGQKRDASRGSFVDSVSTAAEGFYAGVLQNLRAWKAAPPKLKKAATTETDEVADAIDRIVSSGPGTADQPGLEAASSTADVEPSDAPSDSVQDGMQGLTPPMRA